MISGFPATPSPPKIPDTILGAWFDRPPTQFTRQLPPIHISGLPSLLREDSSFQLNSQLLHEFTASLQHTDPVHLGTWGTIVQGNLTPNYPGNQHFDRLQIIPMASETSTADASVLKFWWHQHLLLARNLVQERFANSRAGATIISEHLQAFLLTAINLMKLAKPGPTFELRQPHSLRPFWTHCKARVVYLFTHVLEMLVFIYMNGLHFGSSLDCCVIYLFLRGFALLLQTSGRRQSHDLLQILDLFSVCCFTNSDHDHMILFTAFNFSRASLGRIHATSTGFQPRTLG